MDTILAIIFIFQIFISIIHISINLGRTLAQIEKKY